MQKHLLKQRQDHFSSTLYGYEVGSSLINSDCSAKVGIVLPIIIGVVSGVASRIIYDLCTVPQSDAKLKHKGAAESTCWSLSAKTTVTCCIPIGTDASLCENHPLGIYNSTWKQYDVP